MTQERIALDGKKILVLDDQSTTRNGTRLALSRWTTAQIKTAPCEGNPVAVAEEWMPDLILLDVYARPGTEYGCGLIQQLKDNLATRHIPIVIYTNYPQSFCEEYESYRNNSTTYLRKFPCQNLVTTVTRLLKEGEGDKAL